MLEVVAPAAARVKVSVRPGTRLANAYLASAAGPPCQGGVPVTEVEIDQRTYGEGPATLEASNTILLRFPLTADKEQPAAGIAEPLALDLNLQVASETACLRVPVPPTGSQWWAQGLSLHLAPREPPR